jgi:tRNA(Ile)-lysidine synthase
VLDAVSPPPLSLSEFAAALEAIGGFEARPAIAVAVSGGPDSMALALLADAWARERDGQVVALTVDHGLRPESGEEVRIVAGWLAGRGIPHAILTWEGAKPASGIQEAARVARYGLLAEWCRRHGVLHLLTAHHRDDQGETHLIRRRAGSGIDGLAAMSALRELPGCRLVRPLLAMPPARLAALLAAENQPFVRDPSNLNPAFERARLRVGPEARSGAALGAAIDAARARGRERIAREAELDRLIGRAVALHPTGFAAIYAGALAAAEADLAERLLARVAACIGAARYPTRGERLARLRADLAAAPDRARTLGGCRFVPWRGHVLVLRELAAASLAAAIEPGGRLLWDRRFDAVLAPDAPESLRIGYLGSSSLAGLLPGSERDRSDLPRLVHPVLPAFWDRHSLAAVPHLGYARPGLRVLPLLHFRPANPLTRAPFTVV